MAIASCIRRREVAVAFNSKPRGFTLVEILIAAGIILPARPNPADYHIESDRFELSGKLPEQYRPRPRCRWGLEEVLWSGPMFACMEDLPRDPIFGLPPRLERVSRLSLAPAT
jgi:prepilin-type N-terminal cleavage/methylation domain-containing protein